MGFMREAPAPETTEWTISEAEKPLSLEPISAEALNLANEIPDKDTQNIVLRYASLYLNTLLHKVNEAEQYELRRLEDVEMPEIEEGDPRLVETIRKIEKVLCKQEAEIRQDQAA